ncbi:S41 family peptidase [uncultured Sphingomonas sp.]|uniref:S41 family peptidase n=1 Tax=uncultured Sphingomonas sp. TaxID=158754 RepID=UPI0025DC0553|nr:S41 family peptidase [uncultured Sphingomonas sp.]
MVGVRMGFLRSGVSAIVLAALLASCGGGGSGGGSGTVVQPGSATPTPTASSCSLRARQDWLLATMREWYLFPETLPANLDPGGYTTADAYLDALTATARAQGRDRYFTYLTSITQETAYYNSGSSAGFGFRLSSDGNGVTVTESFEGSSALQAGIDRGAQILAIGTSSADLRDVTSIYAAQGSAGITDALGPSTAGTTRVLRVRDPDGTVRIVTLAKTDYALTPVSSRYGAQILTDPNGGGRVGYVNLRTFINTADPALRAAFASFKAQGIDKVIVDLRYNGGGLVAIAELFGDLLGGARASSDVFSFTSFRPEKSANDSTRNFMPQPEAIAPTRIAFIGTRATASASELVINGMIPYFHANLGLIGTNTYGKPVGQVAIDRSDCDDRLRVIAFATQNANRQGGYFNGLAGNVEASCSAADDVTHPLGDVREASVKAALDFVAGRSCSPIGGISAAAAPRELLTPARPNTAQREVPGLF